MEHEEPCCPFLNADDVHCDRYVRLDRLKLAFDYCFSDFAHCPEYRRLKQSACEDAELDAGQAAFAKALVQVRVGTTPNPRPEQASVYT